jgi:DNA-binding beta-propeller fold protein YncE
VANTGAGTVSVLRTDSSGTQVSTLAVMTGSNVVSIAPDGKHALVYFDSTQPTAGPPTDSPQSMSALDLTQANPTAYQVTVGYHPTAVSYSSDSTKAFVVSDDGVSIVDLQHLNSAASRLSELVHLYDATVTSTASVSVTPDGANALAHQPGSTILRLVDLAAKDHVDLDLASFFAVSNSDAATAVPLDVSDVVMAPDGSFLLAVIRDRQTILRVPIPSGFDDASQVQRILLPNVLIGAANIGPDEHYAVLYTTVTTTNEQRISILDLTGQTALQTISLHKMVKGVAFDPTGKKAYVLHVKSPGDPTQTNITQDQITARSFAYSVIDLASTASMLQLTLSDPGPIAALPDGSALFILFPAAPWQVQRIELGGFAVDKISIGSLPTGIGIVNKANLVFVSQDQTDGRMTFIDWTNTNLRIRSVAGYELNSSIWE